MDNDYYYLAYSIFFMFQDRLVANDFIQCRKVAEHVVEKIVGSGDVNGASKSEDNNDVPEERVELLCCDQVCVGIFITKRGVKFR